MLLDEAQDFNRPLILAPVLVLLRTDILKVLIFSIIIKKVGISSDTISCDL